MLKLTRPTDLLEPISTLDAAFEIVSINIRHGAVLERLTVF